jgi:sugar/nucleoside kinase (ribokinase family)
MSGSDRHIEAIAAGHICLDITPKFGGGTGTGKPAAKPAVSDILVPGKIIEMDGVELSSGGSVANTGLALSLMGVQTELMGKIGTDSFATILKKIITDYGAGDSLIQDPDSSTSYSVVLAPPGIDRIFLHDPGANNTFRAKDIDLDKIKQSRLFHFGYPPIMKSMFVDGGRELVDLFKEAKQAGVTTSLDMALPDLNSEAGKLDWRPVLETLLPYVDIMLPSIEEIMLMLEREKYLNRLEELGGRDFLEDLDMELAADLGHELLDLGVTVAVIKCGEFGLFGFTKDRQTLEGMGTASPADPASWAERELFSESYLVEDIKSTTGSGDNSIAGFLAALLRGRSFEEAVELACLAGANATRDYSAVGGTESFDAMEKARTAGPQKRRLGQSGRASSYWTYLEDHCLWKGQRESVL